MKEEENGAMMFNFTFSLLSGYAHYVVPACSALARIHGEGGQD